MGNIITIGRQFGSGGRELGRRLSEQLGWAYYDQEIITGIAQRTELSEAYVRQIVEQKPVTSFPIHVGRSFHMVANPNLEQSQVIFQEQCAILREMAERSDCVIVGRCADHILRDLHPLRIFVYADMASKMARCRRKEPEREGLSDRALRQRIQAVDKHRAQYYEFYTGQIWGDKENYDLCINTTGVEIKRIAGFVAKMFG